MSEPDTTGETEIGRDWSKLLALAAICVSLVAISFFGMQIEPSSWPERRFHRGSFVIFPVFAVFAPYVISRMFLPWGAPVRLSPVGFADLRVSHQIIPWDEISNVVRRGEYVTLTLRRRFAKTYSLSVTQRVLKSMRKSAGPTHLLVVDWCLDTSPNELCELVTTYHQAHSSRSSE